MKFPKGAKWDAQITNDDRDMNVNWDGIWDLDWPMSRRVVRRDPNPFRTLRFAAADPQTWGVNFMRRTISHS